MSNTQLSELLPCPFCGKAVIGSYTVPFDGNFGYKFQCEYCGGAVFDKDMGKCRSKWNSRTLSPAQVNTEELRKDKHGFWQEMENKITAYIAASNRSAGEGKEEKKCPPGCKKFEGHEGKHLPECPFYPESISKMLDDAQSSIAELERQNKQFLEAAAQANEWYLNLNWDDGDDLRGRYDKAVRQIAKLEAQLAAAQTEWISVEDAEKIVSETLPSSVITDLLDRNLTYEAFRKAGLRVALACLKPAPPQPKAEGEKKGEEVKQGDWVKYGNFEGILEREIDGIHKIWNGDKEIEITVSELKNVIKSQPPSDQTPKIN
jgi:hypothetical protein